MTPLARAVYTAIRENPGITVSSLADAFGITEEDVTQAFELIKKFIEGARARANATGR
jgi:predicted transcriptional regulator